MGPLWGHNGRIMGHNVNIMRPKYGKKICGHYGPNMSPERSHNVANLWEDIMSPIWVCTKMWCNHNVAIMGPLWALKYGVKMGTIMGLLWGHNVAIMGTKCDENLNMGGSKINI